MLSALRRSFFFPKSYIRSALPIPATSLPWKAINDSGTSSVSVCSRRQSGQENGKSRRTL